MRGMRLVRREASVDRRFSISECALHLPPGLPGEEVPDGNRCDLSAEGRKALTSFRFAQLHKVTLQRPKFLGGFCLVCRAVKQRDEHGVLVRRFRVE